MSPGSRSLAALLFLALLAGACSDPSLAGMVRDPLPNVSGVSVPEVGGGDFAFSADPGQVLVVYFGYTNCPDVCPTTLADLRLAVADLGDDADRIDVAMVTVDPGRDDAERLSSYVRAFFPEGHALRTEDADRLNQAAFPLGVAFEVSMAEDGTVEVAHSSFLYAIDSEGFVRVQWPFGMSSEDMRNDLRKLLAP